MWISLRRDDATKHRLMNQGTPEIPSALMLSCSYDARLRDLHVACVVNYNISNSLARS
jgi:hypothetical protein